MAAIRKTLDLSSLDEQSPFVPPSGYSVVTGSDPSRIFNRIPKVWEMITGGVTSIVRDNTALVGRYRAAEVKMNPFGTSPNLSGTALLDSGDDGIAVMTSSGANNYRIFSVTNGQMNTTALWTSTAAAYAPNAIIRLVYDNVDNKYRVYLNGTQVFSTGGVEYTSSAFDPAYAASVSRGGSLVELTSEYETSQSVSSLDNPLVVGQVATGEYFGFDNGVASFAGGGLVINTTISGNESDIAIPMLSDGAVFPFLPAAPFTWTLTQGEKSANISRALILPDGHDTLRDIDGLPANFDGVVTDDPTYPGYWFYQAGEPLGESDRAYWDAHESEGVKRLQIECNGKIYCHASIAPLSAILWIHRGDDGRVYAHEAIITEAGIVPGSLKRLTAIRIKAVKISAKKITAYKL